MTHRDVGSEAANPSYKSSARIAAEGRGVSVKASPDYADLFVVHLYGQQVVDLPLYDTPHDAWVAGEAYATARAR